MTKPKIAIAGAGPGGLTLARILRQRGVEATVFEREQRPTARPQGGSLDMHAESGQHALALAGLTEEFRSLARYEDQEFRVYDKHGVLQAAQTDTSESDRPEIDRGQLRQMLLESLPSAAIHWGQAIEAATSNVDGTAEALFEDGSREEFDLVVGADGTWSRVRPALSQTRPSYTGVTMYELGIDDAEARFPELADLVGRGLMFALGDSKAIGGHRDAHAHLGIYAGLRVEENAVRNLTKEARGALKSALLAAFDDWSPSLRVLITAASDTVAPRPIYTMPVGHRWEHRAGITMLGDAAHVMSPFGGDGANLAMLDAADLAVALTEHDDWRGAIRSFEATMCDRAAEAAAGANEASQQVFSPEGLDHMLEVFRHIHGAGAE